MADSTNSPQEDGLAGRGAPQMEIDAFIGHEVDDEEEPRSADTRAPFGSGMRERLAAALQRQGIVVAPDRDVVPAAGATDEELVCGICLESPPEGKLATLWCCKNVLCVNDAQHVGVCPFCREEPLVWELKIPSLVKPYER